MHFAETVYTPTGAREFNPSISGVQVLTNFDIVAASGGPNIAVVEQFPKQFAASNPENSGTPGSQWTTCYSYDSVGNLLTKSDNRT